jgi:hypothetical protein
MLYNINQVTHKYGGRINLQLVFLDISKLSKVYAFNFSAYCWSQVVDILRCTVKAPFRGVGE